MKKKISHYFKSKILIGVVVVALVAIVGFTFASGTNGEVKETAQVKNGSVREAVEITGNVAPFEKADLGFEKGGVLKEIKVRVGDMVKAGTLIASLDSADTVASLRGAQAHLAGEEARLSELKKGLRPEELSVETAKFKSSQISFTEARTVILNAFHDSYIKAESALLNNTDSLFRNPQSAVPMISFSVGGNTEETRINQARFVAGEKLRAWKVDLDTMTLQSDPEPYIARIHDYLFSIKNFMSQLSTLVSNLTPGSSGLSQVTIDSYNSSVNTGLATLNTAITSLATGESAYNSASSSLSVAQDQFVLEKAGSSGEALEIQMASVSKASADVLALQAELAKKRVVSPIDGIVTKADAHLGEFVSPGTISFAVISDASFKVEIFVPEVDIAKITVGNTASIKLDAYGDEAFFPAHVVAVDPAETVVEGVPTYRVTLQFDEKDSRVRSGMTANIEIETNFKENVLTVPYRALVTKKGETFVRVLDADMQDYTEVKVITGLKGSDGMVEIISGLSEGQTVVTLLK